MGVCLEASDTDTVVGGIAVDDVAVDDVAVGDVDAEYINKSIIVLCY